MKLKSRVLSEKKINNKWKLRNSRSSARRILIQKLYLNKIIEANLDPEIPNYQLDEAIERGIAEIYQQEIDDIDRFVRAKVNAKK
ncbi:MAG: hypothetical protein K2Q33_02870 [Gammaproteobacteria bacterium]|nr:hypothetical protein [Gammaproteobacteria bacterium]